MSAQQELMKQWMQQWPSAPLTTVQGAIERSTAFQKRWLESANETLAKQRELLDSAFRTGTQLIEQTTHLADAKSPDDYRRLVEELWRKLFEIVKTQSEAQVQQFMKASQAWIETAQARQE